MNLQALAACSLAITTAFGAAVTSGMQDMADAAPQIRELAASIQSGEATASADATVKTMLKALEAMCTETGGSLTMERGTWANFRLSCEGGELGSMKMSSTVDQVSRIWYQTASFDARWAGEVRQMVEKIKELEPIVPSLRARASETEMAIEFELDHDLEAPSN